MRSPTDEQIRVGAKAMCGLNALRQLQRVDFDKMDKGEREHWEDLARVCLTVVLPSFDRSAVEATCKRYIESALSWHVVFDDGRGGNDLTFGDTRDLICKRLVDALLSVSRPEREDCTHRIRVTPRNGAPHGAGFACGLSGCHCYPKEGCGYEPISSQDRE